MVNRIISIPWGIIQVNVTQLTFQQNYFLGWKLFAVTYEASSVDFDMREMEFMF